MKSSTRRKILAALPGTVAEITARVGCSRGTVELSLPVLRKEGDAHICGWIRTNREGSSSALFVAGPGGDAPRGQAPAVTHASYRPFDTLEPTVRYAMRTQPNSVFALAGCAA